MGVAEMLVKWGDRLAGVTPWLQASGGRRTRASHALLSNIVDLEALIPTYDKSRISCGRHAALRLFLAPFP